MKLPSGCKKEKIAHLYWCLDKLKFYDLECCSENYEHLYRYIYNLITVMNEYEDKQACDYYRDMTRDGYLQKELSCYNIKLNL